MFKLSPNTRQRVIALIFSMIVVTVGSAFAIMWMQEQISQTAKSCQQLESELAEKVRRIRFKDERIAHQHQPIVLEGSAGVLRPSMDDQIVWVQDRQIGPGRSYAVLMPYESTAGFARLEANTSR